MTTDYDTLRYDELASISEFCHTLEPHQWDTPSLCEGWRVRDVIGHMSVGYTTPMPEMVAKLARYRFNVPKASKTESIAFASSRTPAELLVVFDSIVHDKVRKGISRVIKPTEGLLDHVVHHEDIRRPLGQRRQVPEERLVAALDVAPTLAGFVGSKARAAGLRLEATDVDWRHGDGPLVRGAGEAILLALTGRGVVLDELDGDGVAVLKQRLAP
ncbi:MAG TPA: maleylpyruvate isomerase family mycothiol-dependent enzyme [Acidimicrobiia bacterium]|nr:maleylpyruvate isomerase family mycothiol-dependent enzyme [Acidimicrobiia bacterium]